MRSARDDHGARQTSGLQWTPSVIRHLATRLGARVGRVVLIAPAAPLLPKAYGNPTGVPLAVFESLWAQSASAPPRALFNAHTSQALKVGLTRKLLAVSVPAAIARHRDLVTQSNRVSQDVETFAAG